jgi:hypothetical protein
MSSRATKSTTKRGQVSRASSPTVTIEQAMLDKALLGAGLGDARTWRLWLLILKAAFAIALTPEEAQAFAAVAGGRQPPAQLWCVPRKALREIARSRRPGRLFRSFG